MIPLLYKCEMQINNFKSNFRLIEIPRQVIKLESSTIKFSFLDQKSKLKMKNFSLN
jgi:hypothetical protein